MQRKSFRLLTLFILLALLSSLALPAFAQDVKPTDPPPAAPEAAPPSAPLGPIGGYTFTNLTGAYADLTGDTPFVVNGGGGSLDDGISADQTIPFPFNFGGSVFTVYRVNTNGWLGFGSPTATTNYSSLNGTVNNVIAFVNRDMDNAGAVYSSVTEGVAPNRIHKIQAKNFYRYNCVHRHGQRPGLALRDDQRHRVPLRNLCHVDEHLGNGAGRPEGRQHRHVRRTLARRHGRHGLEQPNRRQFVHGDDEPVWDKRSG